MKIIAATKNKNKLREFGEILKGFEIISQEEAGIDIDVEEDKDTFEGNAIKKAETIAKALNGKMCIADDSGIEIEYLDGFPGILTKRWHTGTDRERNLAIIEKVEERNNYIKNKGIQIRIHYIGKMAEKSKKKILSI